MNLSVFASNAAKFLKANSPEILTGFSVAGVGITGYLAAKAGIKTAERLKSMDKDAPLKEKARVVWDLYVPPTVSGAATIACVIGSSHVNSKRAAAAATAFSVTEAAFSEYKEKVVEQIGENKERKIRDEIAQDKVTRTDPNYTGVLITGAGEVMCFEMFTGRYFRSDMETLRRAQNTINAKIISDLYVTLDEFYYEIKLPGTPSSNNIGWDSNRLMELEFSAVLGPDGVPCIAFDYNYVKSL